MSSFASPQGRPVKIHRKVPLDWPGSLLAAVIGAGIFWIFIGWHLADPRYVEWLTAGDAMQHLLGLNFFVNEGWNRVPGVINGLAQGMGGTSIVFTDSLPLASFIFKLWLGVSGAKPGLVQHFGIWIALSMALQSLFAFRCLRVLGLEHLSAWIGAALLTLSAPMWLRFLGHDSLMSHWLLLWAWYLLLADHADGAGRYVQWALAGIVALGTHFYLFAMLLPIWALWMLDLFLLKRRFPQALAVLVLHFALWGAAGWAYGYFVGAPAGGGGFGVYSSDVLTFFNPGALSAFLPALPALENSAFEGYAYLGCALWLLLLLSPFIAHWRERDEGEGARRLLRQPIVTAVLAVVFGFAVTDTIHVAGRSLAVSHWLVLAGWVVALVLLSFRSVRHSRALRTPLFQLLLIVLAGAAVATVFVRFIPVSVEEVLRSSGRLSWVTWYLVAISALAYVGARLNRRIFLLLVSALLLLQAAETHQAYSRILQGRIAPRPPAAVPDVDAAALDAALSEALPGKKHLVLVGDGGIVPGWDALALFALEHGLSIDKVYLARMDNDLITRYTANRVAQLRKLTLQKDAIYVVYPNYVAQIGADAEDADESATMKRVGPYALVADRVRGFAPVRPHAPPFLVRDAATVDFGAGQQGAAWLGKGWWPTESWGAWSRERDASLTFWYQAAPGCAAVFRLLDFGPAGSRVSEARFETRIDGQSVAAGRIEFDPQARWFDLRIPLPQADNNRFSLSFHIENPRSPAALKESEDPRLLGIAVRALRFECVDVKR